MTKLLLSACLLLAVAALAGGVLHLVDTDDGGDVVLAPRVDTHVLGWWMERAETLATEASTLDEAAAVDPR